MSDTIMARLRGGAPTYRKVFTGDAIPDIGFEIPAGVEYAHEYAPLDGPESNFDLYYVVLDQEQKEKMVDPYIDALNSGTDFIAQTEYNAVNALYRLSGRKLLLTKINAGSKIGENGRTVLAFGERSVQVEKLSFGIEFSGEVDAYYDGMDRVYFSKFSKAKSLFKDFDEFYNEAWYDDKESFLNSKLFAVGEIEPEDIGPSETKLIAEVRDNYTMDLDDEEIIKKIKEYVRKYPLSGVLLQSDGRIKITTKDDLRCVVKLLTQRYYTSEITGEPLQARGTQRMKDQKAKKIVNGQVVSGPADNQ